MIEGRIANLSAEEKAVLYFVAYNNCWLPSSAIDKFRESFKILRFKFDRILNTLERKDLISIARWTYEFAVPDIARVGVLLHMLYTAPEVAQKIKNIKVGNCTSHLYAALEYAMNDVAPATNIVLDAKDINALKPYADAPWIDKALTLVSDNDYYIFIDNLVYASVIKGVLVPLKQLKSMCEPKGRPQSLIAELKGIYDLYAYISEGVVPNLDGIMLTEPHLMLMGIRAANRGDYDAAIKTFALALKSLNKKQQVKNVFFDLIPQFYYVMSLVHSGSADAQKKLKTLSNKPDEFTSIAVSRQLSIAFTSDNRTPLRSQVERLYMAIYALDGEPSFTVRDFARLFDKYFDLGIMNEWTQMPLYAIMRHEMRDYLPVSDTERQRLKEVYGDTPILTSIHRKESWEWMIEDIIHQVNSGQGVGVAPGEQQKMQNRIIYVQYSYGFEPKYQTVLKSGNWSAPRNVSIQRFMEGNAEYMDDTDLTIASVMKSDSYSGYYYSYDKIFRPELILPYLVGSDRVFATGKNGELKNMEVREAKPYLEINKAGGGYLVTAPMNLEQLGNMKGSKLCVKGSDGNFDIYQLSDAEKKIYMRLLTTPFFPDRAATQLQQFLLQLADVTDVRSSLLDSGAVLDMKGGGLVSLKVHSTASSPYPVSISVLPVGNGTVYCTPATGKKVYYDNVEGRVVRVKRDFQSEQANYRTVIDMLDDDEAPVCDGDYDIHVEVDKLLDMLEFVKQNPGVAVIEWPKGKEIRLKSPLAQGSWNVGLKSDNGWFDIEGEVRVDDSTVIGMTQLLELVATDKGRFIRLGENDFIEIDRKLRRQLERIEAMAVKNRNKLQLSQFSAAALDDAMLDGEVKFSFDEKLQKLRERIADSANLNEKVPRALKAKLRPYQTEGFQWMARLASWGAGACLADDMGLGKTVQTIAFLLLKAKEGPALITAPASVVPNWLAEIERFAPSLNAVILNKADNRAETLRKAGKSDVIITSYGLLNTEDEILKKEWTTVCLDEAHTIKNRDTKMSQAAMTLQAAYRIILTGTPIQNHLGELWNLFRFINPGLLGSFESFRRKFVVPIQEGDKDRQRALQRMLKPFMLRRTKDEVVDDLPDKTDIVLQVELTDQEMAMYEAMRLKAVSDLEKAQKLDVNTLAEITKLRRAACAISLVDSKWHGTDSKVQRFLDLVDDFKGDGSNRMLVFSQFTSFLDIVRAALDAKGEKYLYLDGSTTMKQREKLVQEFRDGACQLFLISLKAGGLGLNLPEANYVVHLDPWWNPAIEQQATDRAHRIGQKRNVTVYHLIAKNTIEEKIRRLHRTKRDLADSLLEGSDMAGKLTVQDILALVSPE